MTLPNYLDRKRIGASTIAGAIAAAALAGAVLVGFNAESGSATVTAAAAMLLFGLPHGTFDIELIRRDRASRAFGLLPLLALYLGCAMAMYILWQARPVVALLLFIAIATWHFAEDWTDTGNGLLASGIAAATLIAPVILHRTATAAIFAAVAGTADAVIVVKFLELAAPVSLLLALAAVVALFLDGYRERALAATVTLAAMTLLPPIPGFALFFCLFHSPRHFGAARRNLGWHRPAQWLPVVMPLTLAASGITALLYHFGAPLDVPSKLAASAFLVLSVLTAPHMTVPLILPLLTGRRRTA